MTLLPLRITYLADHERCAEVWLNLLERLEGKGRERKIRQKKEPPDLEDLTGIHRSAEDRHERTERSTRRGDEARERTYEDRMREGDDDAEV